MKFKNYLLIFSILLVASGCATVQNSAFDKTTQNLDFGEKSYFIMGVELDNAYKPKYQPSINMVLYVETPDAKDKNDRFNVVIKAKEFLSEKGAAATGYFRGALKPGDYVLKGIGGVARKFPFTGFYLLPMETKFSINENEVIYLGRLRARTRARKEGEFRSGPLLPLLDQSASGFSGSTFDVLIQDDSEIANQWLNTEYPVLSNKGMQVRILPKYDRSKFDEERAVQTEEPVFFDKAGEERLGSVAAGETSTQDLIRALNSKDPYALRDAAKYIGANELYNDEGINGAAIFALRNAVDNSADVTDKYLIDGLAWCAVNLGNSNDSRKEEIFSEVAASDLPKKIRNRAIDALKKK